MPLNSNDVPKKQRALILQGGGALGAYEAGAVRVLCDHLVDENKRKKNGDKKDGPLFDIVAGTSIGAMNAAILVSNVVNRKKPWKEAARVLERFWIDKAKEEKKKGGLSSTARYSDLWWEGVRKQNNLDDLSEAARRYYSVKDYLRYGAPNVFFAPVPELDSKFGDAENTWYVYNSYPLEQTIKRYSKNENDVKKDDLRIATTWVQRQPRLLVISVDVAKGKTVTFDSYHTEAEDPGNSQYDRGDGITINHIMASGTLPVFYKFRKIPPTRDGRSYCDGGVLSNTPLRELLQAHRDYWKRVVGENQDEIPNLDVYIINVHPPKHNKVPTDLDSVKDRINDITFSDRNSHYDEMVANLATDYTDLLTEYTKLLDNLKELAKSQFGNIEEKDRFRRELEHLLTTTKAKNMRARSKHGKYEDLVKARFRLSKVKRIEPKSYDEIISAKGADFTSKTIKSLIVKGKKDARRVLKLH